MPSGSRLLAGVPLFSGLDESAASAASLRLAQHSAPRVLEGTFTLTIGGQPVTAVDAPATAAGFARGAPNQMLMDFAFAMVSGD